ncbi:MAG TPA: endo alpha-1,4 polygalactosaminidase [Streptosporangiaceae bacterium]
MRCIRSLGTLTGALLVLSALPAAPAWAGPAAGDGPSRPAIRSASTLATALPAPVPCNTSAGSCWQPPVTSRWQYQLQGSVNSSGQCLYPSTGFINTAITGTSFATGQQVAPTVFDIDIYQDGKCYTPNNYAILNTAAVSALHTQGDKVIGYLDAGTAETWRPDYPQYQSFNASCGGCLFGKPVGGFRDEFWLNINTDVSGTNPNTGQTETAQQFVLDELTARLAQARAAGADAIEFDNVDAYQNKTGLTITAATQEQFDAAIANLAHANGFTVGLKNDLGQASDLQPYFDFAVNEQCWQYKECNFPPPGLQAWPSTYGKAVFNVEYKLATSKFCPQANSSSYDFSSILKDVNLYDVPYAPCR